MRLRALQLSDARRRHNARIVVVRRALALGTVALALMSGLVLAVPSARAAVGGVLQQFGLQRFGLDLVSAPLQFHVTSSGYGPIMPPPRLSLAEGQRLASFPIHYPTWLPAGVEWCSSFAEPDTTKAPNSPNPIVSDGIGIAGSANRVSAAYGICQNRQLNDPVVILDIGSADSGGSMLVDASKVKEVTVKGHQALFAQGAWNERGEWMDDAPTATLSWSQDNGVKYLIRVSYVSLDDLWRIAESIGE
jgi:hypothetical protein